MTEIVMYTAKDGHVELDEEPVCSILECAASDGQLLQKMQQFKKSPLAMNILTGEFE